MWTYIRQLFQLLLSPARGWEDVSASDLSYENLLRKGFVPLLIITALSEFVQLAYSPSLTFWGAFGGAIAIGGGLFASLYAARLFLDVTLSRYINSKVNLIKVNTMVTYMIGLDCFYRILADVLPATMTFLSFLPLISILVLFKSTAYIEVPEDKVVNYLLLTFAGVIVFPVFICALLLLII